MSSIRRLFTVLVFALLILPAGTRVVVAQDVLELKPAPASGLWIDGTSNKSAWTVEAKELAGHVTVSGSGITEAEIVVPAEKLESGRSRIMDRLMYRALKTGQHGSISFKMGDPVSFDTTPDGISVVATGTLSIAGTEKVVEFPVTGSRSEDGSWLFSGQYTLLMTDYGIDPPTAMFGALHTGDEVTIRFAVTAGP